MPTLKVLEIHADFIIIQTPTGEVKKSTRIKVPSFTVPGDLIRHVEHGFYDVVDEKGNPIFRR